ncbi:DNA-packaging protein, partial [Piscirickettsia litoralis]|uniref:DNA-packaging protein n=1 Tax=Piscirickettsia litoralis TaxID=1891921 RepID=UPI00138FD82D
QELEAEILDDTAGALWTRKGLDQQTIKEGPEYFQRIVVAIDPSVTSTEESDECGLVVAAIDREGKGYLLEDASDVMPPDEWCERAVQLYKKWNADLIVAETNQGGDLVESMLRTVDKNIPYKKVHAYRGKIIRAEPVANLYTQGKCYHLGCFPVLEDQLCTWTPDDPESPDRLDALVYAFTELMIDSMDVPDLGGINFKGLAEKSYRKNPFGF